MSAAARSGQTSGATWSELQSKAHPSVHGSASAQRPALTASACGVADAAEAGATAGAPAPRLVGRAHVAPMWQGSRVLRHWPSQWPSQ